MSRCQHRTIRAVALALIAILALLPHGTRDKAADGDPPSEIATNNK